MVDETPVKLVSLGLLAAAAVASGSAAGAPREVPSQKAEQGALITAEAEEDEIPRPLLAFAAGMGISLVSLGTGAVLISRSQSQTVRNVGLLAAQGGLTIAPIVAHAIVGESRRGLLLALAPFAAEAAMATMMAFQPSMTTFAPVGVQIAYAGLMTLSVIGSAFGTADAVYVGERSHARGKGGAAFERGRTPARSARTLWGSPMLGQGVAGAMIGGSL